MGYEYEILYQNAYTLLRVNLNGESIQAEAGAMVYKSSNITLETQMKGGLLSSLKRKMLGAESIFLNTFRGEGEIAFAPSYPGDITHIELRNEIWFLQGGSYLCSSPELEIDTKFQGLKGIFSREGLFFLKVSGSGDLFVSIFGALEEKKLSQEEIQVDTGHLVAFSKGISYDVERIGGLKSTMFSGEGLILRLSGTGRLLLQSRSVEAFASWLYPFMPIKTSKYE
ncbi:MAG: TIGR00266 family protein [Candidatus Methanofastidiosia archaeon]